MANGNETKKEVVKFRATMAQKCAIQMKALDYGFSSASAYIIWACLEEDHTEKGSEALTSILKKMREDNAAALEKVCEDSRVIVSAAVDEAAAKFDKAARDSSDRAAVKIGEVVSGVDGMTRENAERVEGIRRKFEETLNAARASIEDQKNKFWAELLPVVGVAAALVVGAYIFRHFFR
jgi:hypothetical protein